jgi:hypothetical protein
MLFTERNIYEKEVTKAAEQRQKGRKGWNRLIVEQ